MFDRYSIAIVLIGVAVIGAIIGAALVSGDDIEGTNASEIVRIANPDDLKSYLQAHQGQGSSPVPLYLESATRTDGGLGMSGAQMEKSSAPASYTGISAGYATTYNELSADYSTTNLQVAGVDEADFVKNDGKYIYILSCGELSIIDAYPAENAKTLSTTRIEGNPGEMFLNDDRLVIFASGWEQTYITPASSVAPVPYGREMTHAYVYDISDRIHPILDRDIAISGSYYDSRMVGDYVYAIASESVPWVLDEPLYPGVRVGDGPVTVPDLYRFRTIPGNFVYNTISSFNVNNDSPVKAETYLSGYSSTLYCSPDNLYIAYANQQYAPRPLLAGSPSTSSSYEAPREETIIHRFAIQDGTVRYQATGDVPGHLLNQFSLDEFRSNLRVATTVDGWSSSGSYQYNNVYVLDSAMDTVGRLEYIAPDEKIYSTRFLGDRLYMVTFKRIDPFFVIDLSDPKNPGILGKLKIPGYSDYLHPYDENHIIGIGKETESNEWGGVSVGGLKLALFDVSDVNNPVMVDKVEIGDAGTDSAALQDHKAFLFDKEKDLLVIPVSEVEKTYTSNLKGSPYGHGLWQGAYVFGVDPDNGFIKKGTVTHRTNPDAYYYWNSPDAVKRSLYIGNVLYTISSGSVIMTDLNDLSNRLNEVDLPDDCGMGVYPMMVE
jgi:inhibitor of cysteine peptidase